MLILPDYGHEYAQARDGGTKDCLPEKPRATMAVPKTQTNKQEEKS
jgi:hypothetical protein